MEKYHVKRKVSSVNTIEYNMYNGNWDLIAITWIDKKGTRDTTNITNEYLTLSAYMRDTFESFPYELMD